MRDWESGRGRGGGWGGRGGWENEEGKKRKEVGWKNWGDRVGVGRGRVGGGGVGGVERGR